MLLMLMKAQKERNLEYVSHKMSKYQLDKFNKEYDRIISLGQAECLALEKPTEKKRGLC